MISTRDLSRLPGPEALRRAMQSMAMLDAILWPDWQGRYYSFNSQWSAGEQMGSMRDGCGDDLHAHFGPAGCWIKGFAHEALMSPFRETPPKVWPGVYDTVPAEFAGCLKQAAFDIEAVTFCIWHRYGDTKWQVGTISYQNGSPDPDGSVALLSRFNGLPTTYREWAEDYYECDVDIEAVSSVFRHERLTSKLVRRLKSTATLRDLTQDRREIGY